MRTEEIPDILQDALLMFGDKRYREGLNEGLFALEKVRGWLTRQPDRKWQAEVREWITKLIEQYRKHYEGYIKK